MNYLGYLSGFDLENLSLQERNELFVSKGLFSKFLSIAISKDGSFTKIASNNANENIEPSFELREALYLYITQTYDSDITGAYLDFFHAFNNEIYGLEDSEMKKITLDHFKEFVNDVSKDTPAFLDVLKLEDGSERIENQNKLEILFDKQNALKFNLINEMELLVKYLIGDSLWFNMVLVDENEILNEVIDFETKLKIILGLNERFLFEKDTYFKNPLIAKKPDESKVETSPLSNTKRTPLLTDQKAIEYLLKNVFNHKRDN